MNLTKNERTVVKFLLKDARTPDAVIARSLNISLQAVRNIRKKLERKEIIKGYTTLINYEQVGVNLFAIALFRVTPKAWAEFSEASITKWLSNSNSVKSFRVPNGDITHIIHYGFRDFLEMNNFFQNLQSKFSQYVELKSIYTICNGNLIKDSHESLINQNLSLKYQQPKLAELK